VAAQLWWMWVFASAQETVYAIQPGRGFEQATEVLGQNFPGFLGRDGWSIYRQFVHAFHQTCLAHLLRRCREMIQVRGTRAQFPARIQVILQAALALRDRRQHRHISAHGLEVARGKLEARLDRALYRRPCSPDNRRLADHLLRERDAIFTFLYCPGLEATNWRAEQAIRPMVVTRKVWGGNRTLSGARTQSILLSFLQTCRQHNRHALPLLTHLLCSPHPQILSLPTQHSR
jgi:transposase